MSVALPTHIADAVSSAANTGKGVAGTLLQEASQVAEHAAEMTSTKARRLLRSARSGRRSTSRRGGRKLFALVALGGAAWAAISARARFQPSPEGVRADRYGTTRAPVDHERNGAVTSHNTDEVKGRIKEAAGAITDDDDLKSDGKRDQAAASAKKAVDTAKDKVSDGIDAVKDTLNRN
jgi:uncharacterized protein YjbJ (UPF0337 family)